MALAMKVETLIRAEASRDTAAREVVKEMQGLGIVTAILPELKAIVHMEDTDKDPAVWVDTDVFVDKRTG